MKSLITNITRRISTFRALRLPSLPVLAMLLVISGQGLRAAEGPIVAVQETLKKQQFFFGEPNGVLDEPTRAALRRFQIRHGLKTTGELDTATMNALQRPAPPPPATSPPVSVAEKDRQFLEGLEEGRAQLTPPGPSTPAASGGPPPSVVGAERPVPAVSEQPPQMRVKQVAPPPAPVKAPVPRVGAETRVTTIEPRVAVERDVTDEVRSSAVRREKPHWEPTPSSENAPVARSKPLPRGPEMETRTPAGPPRVAHPRVPPSRTRIVESDADQSVEPAGTRITRTITTGPDGRTYITERKTTTVSNAPIPIRRAEPVEPRHREGFFQRLFRDDRDD